MDPLTGPNNRNTRTELILRSHFLNYFNVAVHGTFSVPVASRDQKPGGRRKSATSEALEEHGEAVEQQERVAELSNYDSCYSALRTRLCEEIDKNDFDHNKTGFLPRNKLIEILSAERIERELRLRDAFLAGKKLRGLRFSRRKHNSDGKRCFLHETQKILGHPDETSEPPSDKPDNVSGDSCATVKKSYVQILAILILIERPGRIKLFIDAEVSDEYLPFAKCKEGETSSLRRKSAPHEQLACFDDWSSTLIHRFEQWQWAFIIPSFKEPEGKMVPHLTFQPSMVLPVNFVKEPRKGGFAEVQKVIIDKEYREFKNDEDSNWCFAIKRLTKPQSSKGYREDFKREVAALRRFNGDTSKHLVSLKGTYERYSHFHMIFPWAESDLFEFWKRHNPSSRINRIRRTPILEWVAEQCQGLAEGLGFIHRYATFSGTSLLHSSPLPLPGDTLTSAGSSVHRDFKHPTSLAGRHGDLKPENILWYPHPSRHTKRINGILKIADFGFVEFSREERVDKRRRGFEVISTTYAPPEGKLREINLVGSSYDIWSLGCIYLDFIAWWLGGWDRIDEFAESRLQTDVNSADWEDIAFRSDVFFQTQRNQTTRSIAVKQSVLEFIERSKSDPKASKFTNDFLDLIQKYMLIVLDDHGKGRSSATTVRNSIEAIRKKHLKVNHPEED